MSTAYGSGPAGLSGTHYGGAGLGVRGSLIPSAGAHGPAIPYAGLSLPAEADDEFICHILTVPGSLTSFFCNEDGSIDATGPDGTHTGTWRGRKNGTTYGESSWSIAFGSSGTLSGTLTLDGIAAGGGITGQLPPSGGIAGTAVLDGVSAGGGMAGQLPPSGGIAGTAVLDDLVGSGNVAGQLPPSGNVAGNAVLDDVAASGNVAGQLPPSGNIAGNAVLDDVSAGGAVTGPSGDLHGGAILDELQLGGAVVGGGAGLPPASTWGQLRRVVRSGRVMPTMLVPLYVGEVDDIYFDFAPSIVGVDPVLAVTVVCAARVGDDADAVEMRVGEPVFDSQRAVQRVQAGLPGVTYFIVATATLASGRKPVALALLPVRAL